VVFTPNLTTGLDCYVNANFAGMCGYEDEQDPVSVKSCTGFVLTLYGCPAIWSSKLQAKITLSSTAAKYVAFSMAMHELLPMHVLLQELADKLTLPSIGSSLVRSVVFEDNQGCLSPVEVPKICPATNTLLSSNTSSGPTLGKTRALWRSTLLPMNNVPASSQGTPSCPICRHLQIVDGLIKPCWRMLR
jgi:hypothetical protein